MGAQLDAAGDLGVFDGHAQRLHGAGLACGAGGGAGCNAFLPADTGDVGLVHHRGGLVGLVPEGAVCGAGGAGALLHQDHLHGLGGPAVALGAGAVAVLRPAHPAEPGRVHAVPHVVLLGQLPGEPDPHGLHGLGLAGGAGLSGGPALPAVTGDVGAQLDAALILIAVN